MNRNAYKWYKSMKKEKVQKFDDYNDDYVPYLHLYHRTSVFLQNY